MTLPASGSDSAGFQRLADPVRRWIRDQGWSALRAIQESAIPAVLDSDGDLIIAAATAGGKTEAAFLPLISQVVGAPGAQGFDLVYIGPLKALINDQFKRLEDLCARAGIPVHPWHGDISAGVKARARRTPRGILLITHHANLARDHRRFVEDRLKAARLPTTAICTSTLELGIDIGDIACVGQIGAPFSVAALRQRLGRSGRRNGAAVLRMYLTESVLDAASHPVDRLRPGLVRGIAMVDLLIEGQCEPPAPDALHLSTLVHQILSVIAQQGGVSAHQAFDILCIAGPFRRVGAALFARVLRRIGGAKVALIEQAPDGTLLLGARGERIVAHYSFYAVFQTPDEYRLEASGRILGTVPVTNILAPGMTLIFAGQRWRVTVVRDAEKLIEVTADRVGRPPAFGGEAGLIHDMVVARMRQVYAAVGVPRYLDPAAAAMLAEARAAWTGLGLAAARIVTRGPDHWLLATWAGTVRNTTLALALRARGFGVLLHDGFLDVAGPAGTDLRAVLQALAIPGGISGTDLIGDSATLLVEKFHPDLGDDLLAADVLAGRLDLAALAPLAAALL